MVCEVRKWGPNFGLRAVSKENRTKSRPTEYGASCSEVRFQYGFQYGRGALENDVTLTSLSLKIS